MKKSKRTKQGEGYSIPINIAIDSDRFSTTLSERRWGMNYKEVYKRAREDADETSWEEMAMSGQSEFLDHLAQERLGPGDADDYRDGSRLYRNTLIDAVCAA